MFQTVAASGHCRCTISWPRRFLKSPNLFSLPNTLLSRPEQALEPGRATRVIRLEKRLSHRRLNSSSLIMDSNALEACTEAADKASPVEMSPVQGRPLSKNQEKKQAKLKRYATCLSRASRLATCLSRASRLVNCLGFRWVCR